jgi:hypothetical protein
LGFVEGEIIPRPYLLVSTSDKLAAVYFPIAHNQALIGKIPTSEFILPANINELAAGASENFFISHPEADDLSSLIYRIGTTSEKIVSPMLETAFNVDPKVIAAGNGGKNP